MRIKGILLTIIIVLALVFTLFNSSVLMQGATVNLLFSEVTLPLGASLLVLLLLCCIVFFGISLIDRAGQLNQMSSLERQLESTRAKLDKQRMTEMGELEQHLKEEISQLAKQFQSIADDVQNKIASQIRDLDQHEDARIEKLEERVLMMRNELAADITHVEDALRSASSGMKQLEAPETSS